MLHRLKQELKLIYPQTAQPPFLLQHKTLYNNLVATRLFCFSSSGSGPGACCLQTSLVLHCMSPEGDCALTRAMSKHPSKRKVPFISTQFSWRYKQAVSQRLFSANTLLVTPGNIWDKKKQQTYRLQVVLHLLQICNSLPQTPCLTWSEDICHVCHVLLPESRGN